MARNSNSKYAAFALPPSVQLKSNSNIKSGALESSSVLKSTALTSSPHPPSPSKYSYRPLPLPLKLFLTLSSTTLSLSTSSSPLTLPRTYSQILSTILKCLTFYLLSHITISEIFYHPLPSPTLPSPYSVIKQIDRDTKIHYLSKEAGENERRQRGAKQRLRS